MKSLVIIASLLSSSAFAMSLECNAKSTLFTGDTWYYTVDSLADYSAAGAEVIPYDDSIGISVGKLDVRGNYTTLITRSPLLFSEALTGARLRYKVASSLYGLNWTYNRRNQKFKVVHNISPEVTVVAIGRCDLIP